VGKFFQRLACVPLHLSFESCLSPLHVSLYSDISRTAKVCQNCPTSITAVCRHFADDSQCVLVYQKPILIFAVSFAICDVCQFVLSRSYYDYQMINPRRGIVCSIISSRMQLGSKLLIILADDLNHGFENGNGRSYIFEYTHRLNDKLIK